MIGCLRISISLMRIFLVKISGIRVKIPNIKFFIDIAHNFQVFSILEENFLFLAFVSKKKHNFGLGIFLKFCGGGTSCLLPKKEGMDHKKLTKIALEMVIRLGKPQDNGN